MHELRDEAEPTLRELVPHLSPVDLVIVEGFKTESHAKLEVHRSAVGKPLLYPERSEHRRDRERPAADECAAAVRRSRTTSKRSPISSTSSPGRIRHESQRARGAVVGLVLAGGRSVRFGGEKAVALLDGRPLLAVGGGAAAHGVRERGDQRARREPRRRPSRKRSGCRRSTTRRATPWARSPA